MAGVEPYSPCPCGSGQKFKWCCHKVEAFADKSRRLFDAGQVEAAIKVVDEGLQKEPGNPWLLTRKAIMQVNLGQAEPAKVSLRLVLSKNPRHFGALVLLTRCVLETEGPVNGSGMFQQVLSGIEREKWSDLAVLARVIGLLLGQSGRIPAAIRYLELSETLAGPEQADPTALRNMDANPAFSPWLKDRLELAPAPANLGSEARAQFDQALEQGREGLWAAAASTFDRLAAHAPGSEADYNLGLCRLWIGDEEGAVAPLRRRSRALGHSPEAVDLEALAQLIEPIHPDDRVEHVQLTWPLRNREALLEALRSKPDIFDDGPAPFDPSDPESPEVDSFALLDRPELKNEKDANVQFTDIPKILGRVTVGQDTVALETYDDGRVDSLGDRFTVLAGSAIAPAHPRTKVLGEEARSTLVLTWEWLYPAELDQRRVRQLGVEQRSHIIREVWPDTPMPYLGFRSPAKAAKAGDAEIPLRAAFCQFEQDDSLEEAGLDFADLRARMNIPAEPAIDALTVDLNRLPLARLSAVPVESLDDDRLITLYRRARRVMLGRPLEKAARAIAARSHLFEQGRVDSVAIFADLSSLAASRGDQAEASAMIARGRQADTPSRKVANAPLWDMIEVRQRARTEPPEIWVPELAVVLERYAQEPSANQIILINLVELGLVRLTPNPDRPDDVLIDSRPLQAVLAEYGPRVTTASGRLGVSATRPEVWTPGSPAGGTSPGGIWTPGSSQAGPPGSDKPKLIIPGR